MSGLTSDSKRIKFVDACDWGCGEYVLHNEEFHTLVSLSEVNNGTKTLEDEMDRTYAG